MYIRANIKDTREQGQMAPHLSISLKLTKLLVSRSSNCPCGQGIPKLLAEGKGRRFQYRCHILMHVIQMIHFL